MALNTFKKTKKAVNVASKRKETDERFVIYVKAGTCKEKVVTGHKGKNITMAGDGIGKTIATRSDSKNGGYTTFKSATFGM
ncbi:PECTINESTERASE/PECTINESTERASE INHIBITOR 59-RELATED [Salix koriyanagi]|uniref:PECTINESTERASE/PECTINESTERASE INHIBITOR 59-RELATED n=1 Tax=Salix koriyanagi TaxID=2511006 RepID=A0A9Q0Q7F7_9ROSI|nr:PECTINESTERASE/PECTINESTERASE INHIBITOR 59-RELATED [Salix koriyanagi]